MNKEFKILNYGDVNYVSRPVMSLHENDDVKTIVLNTGKMWLIRKEMEQNDFYRFMLEQYRAIGIEIDENKLVSLR